MKTLKSNIDRNINGEKNRCWVDLKRYSKKDNRYIDGVGRQMKINLLKDNRYIDGQIDENIFIER